MAMIKLNIHEAKTHLSRYLAELRKGEKIVLCRRNIAIAEIRRLPGNRTEQRPIGLSKGEFEVPEDFFEPLPSELEEMFSGKIE